MSQEYRHDCDVATTCCAVSLDESLPSTRTPVNITRGAMTFVHFGGKCFPAPRQGAASRKA